LRAPKKQATGDEGATIGLSTGHPSERDEKDRDQKGVGEKTDSRTEGTGQFSAERGGIQRGKEKKISKVGS